MPTVIDTTRANDPRLDNRVTSAILDLVASGYSIPDATRAIALGAMAEARGEGLGPLEVDFAATHVCRLGSDLMIRFRQLADDGGVLVVA